MTRPGDVPAGDGASGVPGTWSAALQALEADVDALDRALSDGGPVVVSSWQPPEDLGPVPVELVPRAQRLAERIAELRGRGRRRLTDLSSELEELDRRRDAGAAYSTSGGKARSN